VLRGRAYIGATAFLPYGKVGAPSLISRLSIETKDENDLPVTIECFKQHEHHLEVPRRFALRQFPLPWHYRLNAWKKRPELFPQPFRPRDTAQAKFWAEIDAELAKNLPVDLPIQARTGTGKTVTALRTICHTIQAPTLVTVPTNMLLRQWRDEIYAKIGKAWADQYLGHIQQDMMDYEGRLIVLGLAPSLAFREYPEELRRYFACMWFDEYHGIGAPKMHYVLTKYSVPIRVGATATHREDALKQVAELHMGGIKVISEQEVMRPIINIVDFRKTLPRNIGQPSPRWLISLLSRFKDRNELLVNILVRGYERGKHIVGLSDRIEQLWKIRERLIEKGLPASDIGVLTGTYEGLSKREIIAEQDRIKAKCHVILCTYGVFGTGQDIASLDMGVELTPRGNLKQALGRILRWDTANEKEQPEWWGIDDHILFFAKTDGRFSDPKPSVLKSIEKLAKSRRRSYQHQKATKIVKRRFVEKPDGKNPA
jgi:superfamily II DNA or RNA helicase